MAVWPRHGLSPTHCKSQFFLHGPLWPVRSLRRILSALEGMHSTKEAWSLLNYFLNVWCQLFLFSIFTTESTKETDRHWTLTSPGMLLWNSHQIQKAIISRKLGCKERADVEIREEAEAGLKAGINQGRAKIHKNGQRWGKKKGNVWDCDKGGRRAEAIANREIERQKKAR